MRQPITIFLFIIIILDQILQVNIGLHLRSDVVIAKNIRVNVTILLDYVKSIFLSPFHFLFAINHKLYVPLVLCCIQSVIFTFLLHEFRMVSNFRYASIFHNNNLIYIFAQTYSVRYYNCCFPLH